jgi:hypothetical protein
MYEHLNPEYKKLGGILLAFYWCSIIGGGLYLLVMALPALIGISVSFLLGFLYGVGVIVSFGAALLSVVFLIRSAIQLKARNPQCFDTFIQSFLILFCGEILSDLLKIRGVYGVGSFISSTIFSIIFFTIAMCINIMYYSKSVRVKVYFDCRPVHLSRYWNWIKLLPEFVTSDSMPDPSKLSSSTTTTTEPPRAADRPVFCNECGAKNEAGTKFCGECGQTLS